MNTLKLFNAVVGKKSNEKPFVSENGFIIESNALYAKNQILDYYNKESLNGNDLNKTFHKSWKIIKNSSISDLFIEQIKHYISTYGSDFKDEVYIPNEVLNIPDIKISYKVIKAYSEDEMKDKCLSLLKSGIALKEETINLILSVLVDDLSYQFTGKENIKNKEAIIKIADLYNVLPENTMEFFRYIIYRSTNQSLLIKNREMIEMIKNSNFNPKIQFEKFGLEKLSEIFNRFKPLFLAYKNKCPKTINKISKLSKINHKPLVENPLNFVTSRSLTKNDVHWLDNATPYALFKAISACYSRKEGQDAFVYRIRNGKSYVKTNETNSASKQNYDFILKYMKKRFDLSDKSFFFPKNVKYALPTSEKMFVGNVPTGTKFTAKKMAVGIYWEDKWGVRDYDLSALNIGGKIGWNSSYNQNDGDLMYSGDLTSAPNGAVEYLYANNGLNQPTLIYNNIYSGAKGNDYKIIIGKGDKVSRDYMMNPNNLFVDIKTQTVETQTILGIIIPEKSKQTFVILNFGMGNSRVSGNSELSNIATKALYQQWTNSISFEDMVKILGGNIVEKEEDSNYNFNINVLEKDTFVNVFN